MQRSQRVHSSANMDNKASDPDFNPADFDDEENDGDYSNIMSEDEDELAAEVHELIDKEGEVVRVVGDKLIADEEVLDSILASDSYKKMKEFKKARWLSQYKEMVSS